MDKEAEIKKEGKIKGSFNRHKKIWIIGIIILLIVLVPIAVVAFQASSASFTLRTKLDTGAAQTNASSTNFFVRFISGMQSVGQYIGSTFSGRFGVLDDDEGITLTTIYGCANLSNANSFYVLNQSVTAARTCFNVTANNVSLNCNGFNITYTTSATGYAVTGAGYNYTTIKNCSIFQGRANAANSYGIYFTNGYNLSIENNSLSMQGVTNANSNNFGIYLNNQKVSKISNNNITSSGRAAYPIYIYTKSNSTNVSFNMISTSAAYTNGIYTYSADENAIHMNNISTTGANSNSINIYYSIRNNITSNNVSNTGNTGAAVYVRGDLGTANSNRIEENFLQTRGTNSYPVYLYLQVMSNIIRNNTLNSYGTGAGIYLQNRVNNTIVDNNKINISAGSSYGILIATGSGGNNITRNNVTAIVGGTHGIYLNTICNNNVVANNSVKSGTYAIRLITSANNLIYNNVFNASGTQLVILSNGASYRNFFNSSKTDISPGKNIIGGNYIGGNYWVNWLGTGFSQTCADANVDGLCDANYSINANNIDSHALRFLTDSISPTIRLWYPSNNSYVNGLVPLIANASDNYDIANVTFQYSNASVAWTNFSNCFFTAPNYNDGKDYRCIWNTTDFSNSSAGYDVRALVYDSAANSGNNEKHYTIDRTKPVIYEFHVDYPVSQSSAKDGQNITLVANVTDSPTIAAGIDYVQAELSNLNSSSLVNMSFFSGSRASDMPSIWKLNITLNTSLSSGAKESNISVYDAAIPTHNLAGSAWNVEIDNRAPGYSGLGSSGSDYNRSSVTFFVSVSDNYQLEKYVFSQNQTGTWSNDSEVSLSGLNDFINHDKIVYMGNFSFKFFIFDDAGNMNETSLADIEILGNAPTPSVYLISPANNRKYNTAATTFEYYYTGAVVENCTLVLDGIENETTLSPAINTTLSFSKSLLEGAHSWYVSCLKLEDEAEGTIVNEYVSEIFELDLDLTKPTITIASPTNTTYASSSFYFNISIDENADACYYNLNNAGNVSLNKYSSTNYHIDKALAKGGYNLVFSCNDTANNYDDATVNFAVSFIHVSLNFTSPLNNSEVVRGGSDSNEDDLGLVINTVNLTARVYNDNNNSGINGASCYFHFNGTYLGERFTNSSGECVYAYDKSSLTPTAYNVSVNFSYFVVDNDKIINNSLVNISLAKYLMPNAMINMTLSGGLYKFIHGGIAKLLINITKTDYTGTSFYEPINLTVNATDSTNKPYPNNEYVSGYRLLQIATGRYQSWVVANISLGTDFIKWNAYASNDAFANYLTTAVHSDIDIVNPVCGNLAQEFGEDCDDGNLVAGDGCDSTCRDETCGNNIKQSGEVCDGTDLNGKTCITQGFAGGTLSCNVGCLTFNTALCTSTPTSSSCFAARTKILMADGESKNIEDVEVGDYVESYDLKKGENTIAKVLELESPMRGGVYEINGVLNVTDEHPLYTKKADGRVVWSAIDTERAEQDLIGSELEGIEVSKLEIGDKLFNSKGKWIKIYSIKYYEGELKTYNLKTVNRYNVFFANDVLVHNKDGGCVGDACPCTSECSAIGAIEKLCTSDTQLRTRECGNFDVDTCLEFDTSSYTDCSAIDAGLPSGSTGICENAECKITSPICENECSSGEIERECSGTNLMRERICGNYDEDSCLEFNDWNTKECSEKEECYNGKCLSQDEVDKRFGCTGVIWSCKEWSSCMASYNIKDVFEGNINTSGVKERICEDLTLCRDDKTERKECDISIPVSIRNSEWCEENYVELYEKTTNKLVSRVKKQEIANFANLSRVDISFITTEFSGWCDYCFDGVKDYDEINIDCGGNNCPACVPRIGFFDWLIWLIIFLWILLLILLILLYRKRKEERKKIRKEGIVRRFVNRIKSWFALKPSEKQIYRERAPFRKEISERKLEKVIERKAGGIWNSIKRAFAIPFRIKVEKKLEYEERKLKEEKLPREVEERKIKEIISREKPSRIKRIIIEYKEARRKRGIERRIRKEEKKRRKEIEGVQKRAKRKPSRLGDLWRRMREWRRKGYYGTAKLEKHLKRHEKK
ncbi:MAG: NosD domain-containing protein [Nanoarchaeota archaeon]